MLPGFQNTKQVVFSGAGWLGRVGEVRGEYEAGRLLEGWDPGLKPGLAA